jgi:hypothetical protein
MVVFSSSKSDVSVAALLSWGITLRFLSAQTSDWEDEEVDLAEAAQY